MWHFIYDCSHLLSVQILLNVELSRHELCQELWCDIAIIIALMFTINSFGYYSNIWAKIEISGIKFISQLHTAQIAFSYYLFLSYTQICVICLINIIIPRYKVSANNFPFSPSLVCWWSLVYGIDNFCASIDHVNIA